MHAPRFTPHAVALGLALALAVPARAQTREGNVATRVVQELHRVAGNLRSTRYQHSLQIDEARGSYALDCSLLVSWVLGRTAPRARAAVTGERPLAVDYWRTLRASERTHGAWQRVARVADVAPGDVLAWRRPPWFPSHNTGHVAFVVGAPERWGDGYLVRVADASSYNHQDDTRQGGTGFGMGTMYFPVDAQTGAARGYGWFGRAAVEWVIPTEVVFARPLR